MQAQATSSRRFGFNRTLLLALAIGAVAIMAAALVLIDTAGLPFTSDSQAVTARPLNRRAFYSQIGFLEQNTQLPTGIVSRPALSIEDMLLLEQDIWAYDGDASSGLDDYLYLEEYVAGKEMDDANSTAPGIHRDEGFTSAPHE